MDMWLLIITFFNSVFNFILVFRVLILDSKIIQNYHFNFECAKSSSKRILICSIGIQNMMGAALFHHEGWMCCSRCLYDKIEQLPPYFECTLSHFRHILNVHRATLGTSMMSLEPQKNTPN
jgi:hypothetical protein